MHRTADYWLKSEVPQASCCVFYYAGQSIKYDIHFMLPVLVSISVWHFVNETTEIFYALLHQ